jgi:O-antigen/teichoic acid export membrane protein
VVTKFYVSPIFAFSGLKDLLSFGLKLSVAQIIWYVNSNLDRLLVIKGLGEHALGLYSVANTLALLPATKIMNLSNEIAFAAYSRIQQDRALAGKYYLESVRFASFVFFPVCWGMSAVADELINVVLGTQWHAAVPVLQIVALGVPYRALFLLTEPVVAGLGEPQLSIKSTLTTTVLVGAFMAIGLRWGLIGLCIASVMGGILAVSINLRRNLAILDLGYADLMSVCLPSMLAAAAMYGVVFGCHTMAFALNGLSPLLRLCAMIALGVLVYTAMTAAFNRRTAIRSFEVVRGSI